MAAKKNEGGLWTCKWEPWGGKAPELKVIWLYDCVVPIEGLHLVISNALGATREFGSVVRREGMFYNSPLCKGACEGHRRITKTALGNPGLRAVAADLVRAYP